MNYFSFPRLAFDQYKTKFGNFKQLWFLLILGCLVVTLSISTEKPVDALGCCTLDTTEGTGYCFAGGSSPYIQCRLCCNGNGACTYRKYTYYGDYIWSISPCDTISDPCFASWTAYFQNHELSYVTRKAHKYERQQGTCSFDVPPGDCYPTSENVRCPKRDEWQTVPYFGYGICSSYECENQLCP